MNDRFYINELSEIRAFCSNSDKEDIYLRIYNDEKEIERLKKDKEIDVKLNLELLDAVGKLNNILNELEKWIDDRQNSSVFYEEYEKADIYGIVLDKIKELRGDDNG